MSQIARYAAAVAVSALAALATILSALPLYAGPG